MNDTTTFLEALLPDGVPDGNFALLWQLKGKASRWYSDLDALAKAAAGESDVYIGCSLSPQDFGRYQRCPAATTSGIYAVWAEVDFKCDGAHQKELLPGSIEEAIALVDSMPAKPSIIVNSGHGIHAWWLLIEPWLYRDDEERSKASMLVHKWNLTLKTIASSHGFTVDSVFDMARVLRIPGTFNAKTENVVPVTIERIDEKLRYDPIDLEILVKDVASVSPSVASSTQADFTISSKAQPPLAKLEAMLENDDKFRSTWNMTRRDASSWSASEYDLSLATMAAYAGWSDQEIVDMLIYFRAKHSLKPKLRADYYQRTLIRAKQDIKQRDAIDRIADISVVGEISSPAVRKDALDQLSTIFGFKVDRIIKEIAAEPTYVIHTELGSIQLGTINAIMSQTQFRNRIAAATGRVISRHKNGWDTIAQVILNACEEVSIGAEATIAGQCIAWLQGYVSENRPVEDRAEAIELRRPFLEDGTLHIFLAPFRAWIRTSPEAGDNISAKSLGQHLRSIGGTPVVIATPKRSTRNVWKIPPDVTQTVIDDDIHQWSRA